MFTRIHLKNVKSFYLGFFSVFLVTEVFAIVDNSWSSHTIFLLLIARGNGHLLSLYPHPLIQCGLPKCFITLVGVNIDWKGKGGERQKYQGGQERESCTGVSQCNLFRIRAGWSKRL